MKYWLLIVLLLAGVVGADPLRGAELSKIEYDWKSVGNLGNAAYTGLRKGARPGETSYSGRVDYEYKMARTQVTNAEYAQFLNSVATIKDPGKLFNIGMALSQGGIFRFELNGEIRYSAKPGWADRPVNYVDAFDSMRYANWINNGQPVGPQGPGTTESGSYTISATGIANNDIVRNHGPGVFLPTEDEWFKAAYHEPGASDDDYWSYPTRSDHIPTPGDVNHMNGEMPAGQNVVNYRSSQLANVGSAGPLSESFYGISGMGGHLWEWTETLIVQGEFVRPPGSNKPRNGMWRSIMGGSRSSETVHLHLFYRHPEDPLDGDCCRGIRLVSISAPEPSSGSVTLATLVGLSLRRRRRRSR